MIRDKVLHTISEINGAPFLNKKITVPPNAILYKAIYQPIGEKNKYVVSYVQRDIVKPFCQWLKEYPMKG